ncbi:ABC transporter substrate-binding protein [Cohaesibacter intestini]|uniref:ABC transporter substrate-binding protein n=1 Tax=Cohaesibacter intestini TaxID=2211145 RepID=UPI000DEB2398|nr:ABC transporter substrate-binding protein [Cohaesibacter intestini]
MRRSMLLAAVFATLLSANSVAAAPPPLVLAVGGEPETGFDPIMGWGRYGNPLFQATLLRLDANFEMTGDLATSWVLSEDRLIWTVTIRTDAKFSDGSPLTAEDVAFTFNKARDAGGLTDMKILKEARATSPDTVELELTKPQITFASQLVALGIVPQKGYGDDYARHPLGAGPFKMVEWREGEQLIVEPNPYWHGEKIAFPRVTFVFGEEAVVLNLARSGAAHLVAVPPLDAAHAPNGMTVKHINTVDNRGIAFPTIPSGGQTEKGHPIGNDVTADRAIRFAINQGLDREALVALALNGHGTPAYGPVDGLPWDNPDAHLEGGDVDAAKATLDAAGWRDENGDGVREKDGQQARFPLVYPSSDSLRQALALGAAEQMRAFGIVAEPRGLSWDAIGNEMHASAVILGWGAHDPSEIYALYHGNNAGVDWYNTGLYRNATVDAHLDAAQSAPSFEASLAEWKAAQWDGKTGFSAKGDAPWAWMVNVKHSYWISDCLDIGPVQIEPHGHGYPITQGLPGWKWTCE